MKEAHDVFEFRRVVRLHLRHLADEPCRATREVIAEKVFQYLVLNQHILVAYPVFHDTVYRKLVDLHTVEKWGLASGFIEALGPPLCENETIAPCLT